MLIKRKQTLKVNSKINHSKLPVQQRQDNLHPLALCRPKTVWYPAKDVPLQWQISTWGRKFPSSENYVEAEWTLKKSLERNWNLNLFGIFVHQRCQEPNIATTSLILSTLLQCTNSSKVQTKDLPVLGIPWYPCSTDQLPRLCQGTSFQRLVAPDSSSLRHWNPSKASGVRSFHLATPHPGAT